MSTSIDYFFNSDKSLQELSDEINECLGTNLRVSGTLQEEQAWCRFFGMSLDFYEHTLGNDGLNDFESFRYKIGLTATGYLGYLCVHLVGMLAYLLYDRLKIGNGMIVYDVQRPLAIYETRIFEDNGNRYEDLFDIISGKQVEMPEHLADLELAVKDQ